MNKLTQGILAAMAATLVTGCDPYNKEAGGTPTVISTLANVAGTVVDGVASGNAWTIADAPSVCAAATATSPSEVTFDVPVIWVKMSKLLDGFSIQSSPSSCVPARNWLTVTPAAPAGQTWYACYNPSAALPTEGGSVVIYRAASAPASGGWLDAEPVEASPTVVTTYRATGRVFDKAGAGVDIDVTVTVAPNPGVPGDATYTSVAQTSLTVNWTAADCGGAATYKVERAPNVAGATPADDAPGTFAVVAAAQAGISFADTGRTANTKYWYRVTGTTAVGGFTGDTSTPTAVTTLP